MTIKAKVGISACLLGELVRYDGGHKHDPFLEQSLGMLFEWVPICPEMECGLGVPRPPMRLGDDPAGPRLWVIESGVEETERLLTWVARRVIELKRDGLAGFVLKCRSPSCGNGDTPVYGAQGEKVGQTQGLFARALAVHMPKLPLADEERLRESGYRQWFVKAAMAYKETES